MSWLFGIYKKQNLSDFRFSLSEEFTKIEKDNFLLYVSKNPNTSFLKNTTNTISAFVGVPILDQGSEKKLFDNSSFQHFESLKSDDLFGHFIIVNYLNNHLNIFNDTLGLRELYYIDSEKEFIFSTRIDLLSQNLNNSILNIKGFSSLWLTNFQLSNGSILNGIKRLGPGGELNYDGAKLTIKHNKFVKSNSISTATNLSHSVSNYFSPKNVSKKIISLGLSGGIDSRFILSYLMNRDQNFKCHSLVNEEHNDLKVAIKICDTFKIEHKFIPRDEINLSDYEGKILQFYSLISPSIPLTQLLDFGIFGNTYLQDFLILDGGFGGFYRRQYLNKIFIRGFSKFRLKYADDIKNLLLAPKPQIFTSDIDLQIQNSMSEIIFNLISSFAIPKNKSDLAEILDLISIQYMLPNIYGPGQTIFDQNFISYMPLAQKDVINYGMNIPLKQKSDSKLFKNLIKENEKQLSRINLVNNNLENSYNLNYKLSMIKLLLHRKFASKENYQRFEVLLNSKEYILDTLESKSIKENKYLYYSKNIKTAMHFFNGDLSKGNYVDWLLTFALWSKANKLLG